jgi:hypothetical protein
VNDVLARRKRFRKLDSSVQQGVLLFEEFDAGTFAVVSDSTVHNVCHALVRNDLVWEFKRRFSIHKTSIVAGCVEGWTALLDVAVTPVAPGDLDGTPLERVWSIQRGIPVTRLKVVGGIRVEGGWLGSKESLPRIKANGQGDVFLRAEADQDRALTKSADGLWSLPVKDLAGPARLVQRCGDQDIDEIRLEFVAAPSVEALKAPAAPATWLREGVGHSTTLDSPAISSDQEQTDWGHLADPVILLGPDVGQFVSDPARAAWQIVRIGNKDHLHRGALCGDAALPKNQVTADHLRRRWRKLLFKSAVDPADRALISARSAARHLSFGEQLDHAEPEDQNATFSPRAEVAPAPNLERIVTALIARLGARAGISLSDWYELLRSISLIADDGTLRSITRAWQEASLIDVASSTRWRSFMIYGRMPALAMFRCRNGWGGTLIGLALPSTVRALVGLAAKHAIICEMRGSCSEWVPATLCLRASTRATLLQLAAEANIGHTHLSMATVENLAREGRARAASLPPVNYAERRPIVLPVMDGDATHGAEMFRWYRRDSPDFWEVIVRDRRFWAYDPNSARIWAALMSDIAPVVASGETVVAERAFVALELARFMSALTGLRSGPHAKHGGRHCYPVHSSSAAVWFAERMSEILAAD